MNAGWLLLLLVLPAVAADPVLVAVAPDLPGPGPGDEGFAVATTDGAPFDWSGYRVTDGEGEWVFPADSQAAAGQSLWVVGNRSIWDAHDGPAPAGEWTDPSLQLSNNGETLHLLGPDGDERDRFAWGSGGDITTRSAGLIYARAQENGGFVDTDQAHDWWTPRMHRIGESALPMPSFEVSEVTLYSSPDSSYQVLAQAIDAATVRVQVHVYILDHPVLVDHLVAAAVRGVEVRVLVDGQPVGHGADDRADRDGLLARIEAAGGQAFLSGTGRYAHHHLKVLVADDTVAIQSENWGATGVPLDPTWGNRGWGVAVHDSAMADWMAAWMADDRGAWDTEPFVATGTEQDPPRFAPAKGPYRPVPSQALTGAFHVTPLIAPEHTATPGSLIEARAATATERVWTQQLRLDDRESNRLGWERDDRWTTALIDAAGRGLDVRAHLAGPDFFGSDGLDAMARLRSAGASVQEFEEPGITLLHNKGWIIDDTVVVGSLNGNHASRSANREVAVLIEGEGVAGFYEALFEADASSSSAWPMPVSPVPMLLLLLAVVTARHR